MLTLNVRLLLGNMRVLNVSYMRIGVIKLMIFFIVINVRCVEEVKRKVTSIVRYVGIVGISHRKANTNAHKT